jgi:hypothetical protein
MTERPITFPKTDDGEWTNRETGVRLARHPEFGTYRVWVGGLPDDGAVGIHVEYAHRGDALAVAKRYVATVARPSIAKAYIEAIAEHVERAARKAEAAGAPTWRADAARREIQYGTSGSARWLASAINEVRRLEEWTAEHVRMEAERIVEQGGADDKCGADDDGSAPQFAAGDLVVFVDVDGTGIDTDAVWRIESVRDVDTKRPYAELVGHTYPAMRSASYFTRIAPAPRCTVPDGWLSEHEFEYNPAEVEAVRAGNDGYDEYERCGALRSHDRHRTDRSRAAAIMHAARDHEGVPTGQPYGGEWPGTTTVSGETVTYMADMPTGSAPASLSDDAAWSGYVAKLPAPDPEAMAAVAVEYSSWTSHRTNAIEGFRSAARMLWSLRAEGLALPGSDDYRLMRDSMRHFRGLIATCDRRNDALRREIAATS